MGHLHQSQGQRGAQVVGAQRGAVGQSQLRQQLGSSLRTVAQQVEQARYLVGYRVGYLIAQDLQSVT